MESDWSPTQTELGDILGYELEGEEKRMVESNNVRHVQEVFEVSSL